MISWWGQLVFFISWPKFYHIVCTLCIQAIAKGNKRKSDKVVFESTQNIWDFLYKSWIKKEGHFHTFLISLFHWVFDCLTSLRADSLEFFQNGRKVLCCNRWLIQHSFGDACRFGILASLCNTNFCLSVGWSVRLAICAQTYIKACASTWWKCVKMLETTYNPKWNLWHWIWHFHPGIWWWRVERQVLLA